MTHKPVLALASQTNCTVCVAVREDLHLLLYLQECFPFNATQNKYTQRSAYCILSHWLSVKPYHLGSATALRTPNAAPVWSWMVEIWVVKRNEERKGKGKGKQRETFFFFLFFFCYHYWKLFCNGKIQKVPNTKAYLLKEALCSHH